MKYSYYNIYSGDSLLAKVLADSVYYHDGAITLRKDGKYVCCLVGNYAVINVGSE